MKPNFALLLSFEGIKLLHRAAGGWREVGEVPVTADDLGGELAMLRKTAASLDPSGVRTKLLIPPSQIKYLTIETPGLSEPARRRAAEAALHDATPYEVSELAFDISVDGPKTHVAAVAKETLTEAEAFATEHRFHPVSFVAVPDDAPYLGEPFFGTTTAAQALLENGETVEPDGIAVVIVGAIAAQTPAETAAEAPSEDHAQEAEAESAPAETGAAAQKPQSDDAAADVPQANEADAEEVEDELPQAPAAAPKGAEPAETAQKPAASAPREDAVPAEQGKTGKHSDDAAAVDAAKAPAAVQSGEKPADLETAQSELALEPSAPTPPPATAPIAKTPAPDQVSEPTIDPKRAKLLAAVAANGPPEDDLEPLPFKAAPPAEDVLASDAKTATGFASRRAQPTGRPTAKPLGGAQRIMVPTPSPSPSPESDAATRAPAVAASVGAAAGSVASAGRSIGGFLSRRKPRTGAAAPMPAPKSAFPASGSDAERMTVFGSRTAEVGGKPRFLGLIMTVILLVFLAGVAAWAAVFLDEGIAGLMQKDKTRATASAPENQIDPEIIRTPDGIDAEQADTSSDVQVAALDPVLSAAETTAVEADLDPRPEPQVPVITEAEAAARYAVTGIWPLAPETPLADPDVVDAPVFRSGIDPDTSASDALALPTPQELDTAVQLAAAISPPPFGQTTTVDENGLIAPTAEGVVTPQGFTLFAASPPLKPPAATLARFAAEPTVTAPQATSALAALRPQNRPLGLAERTERAQLGGVTRGELAAFRPNLRPRSLQQRAKEAEDAAKEAAEQEEARAATAAQSASAASAAAQSAAAAAAAALLVPTTPTAQAPEPRIVATRFATANSKRPDTRPRNFKRIVAQAQRAAPAQTTRVAAAASVAPRTVSPKVPSKASVARSATVKNAINLRKVNLIGVYGKPSSRRALVRLGNGRYKKVKVGDRIDGGRVGAISNSELRYSKGGRNVVLRMP